MTESESVAGSPRQGLIGATLGFFFGFAAVALYSPAAPQFQDAMDLNPTLTGLLVGAPVLFGSLLRIPFGAWCEKNGGRKPFLILMTLSLIGMSGFTALLLLFYPDGMSSSLYPVFFLFGALSGCGIAVFSVGMSQVSYWFPQDRQGWALGVCAGAGNVSPGIFTVLVPIAFVSLGLVPSYLVWLGILAVGTALYYLLGVDAWYFQLRRNGVDDGRAREIARTKGQDVFPEGTPIESLKTSASVRSTWWLVFLYFVTFGGFLAMITWLPTYYQEFLGVDGQTAGILVGVFAIYGSVIRIAGGVLSDRIGGERTAVLALAVLLAGAVVLSVVESLGLAFLGTMIVSTGMGVNNAAVFKKVPEEVPDAVSGASGWIGGLGAFGGFLIPPASGSVVSTMGRIGYARAFIIYVVLAVVGLLIVYTMSRSESGAEGTPAGVVES